MTVTIGDNEKFENWNKIIDQVTQDSEGASFVNAGESLISEKHKTIYKNMLDNPKSLISDLKKKVDEFTEWAETFESESEKIWDQAPKHVKTVSGHINIAFIEKLVKGNCKFFEKPFSKF